MSSPLFTALFPPGHPRFFNQLSCGLDVTSLAGEWLTAAANTNMFTYEIAPVFILMEHECLKKMREIIGFEGGDSILASGGSVSNMYALMIARHKIFPMVEPPPGLAMMTFLLCAAQEVRHEGHQGPAHHVHQPACASANPTHPSF